jgi:P27 family predicted phage terminase small subunit
MADPIRKRPALQVIREGNPGHRPVEPGLMLPPGDLAEPRWSDVFPAPQPVDMADITDDPYVLSVVERMLGRGQRSESERARRVASAEWRRVVPVLTRSAGLADVDLATVRDYCVVVARIDQAERALSRGGALMLGERGWQKSGWTTIVSQYRSQLRVYIRELGLSPSARRGIEPAGGGDDGDDPFS